MREYDKIVIGATFSSILYAFYNQIPIIFAEGVQTHPFDFYSPDIDLGLLKVDPSLYALKEPNNGEIIFGTSKQQVSDKLLSLLSLSGLVPFSYLVKSVRIEEDNLRVITTGNKVFNVGYRELLVFDDKKITGLPPAVENNDDHSTPILDWFDINVGNAGDLDYIETGDDFVSQIFFYPTQRYDVDRSRKDLLSISYLPTREAIHSYQYSDTYARFKILKLMKENGIRGSKNGKNPNYPDRSQEPFKWISPKITLSEREILPLPMTKYKDTKNIKFIYDTPEEIITRNQVKIDTYASKLLLAL